MDSLEFRIINDIQQLMPASLPNGPWVHHATVLRRGKEYIVFRHGFSNEIYLEQVAEGRTTFILQKIEDDNEWNDLYRFVEAAGLLRIDANMKVSKRWLTPGI